MENPYQQVEIDITKMNGRGIGVGECEIPGRSKNATVEVIGSVVGDRCLVEIHGRRKRHTFRGKIVEVLKPSVDRTQPRCRHVGVCGGCSMQAVRYEKQLEDKSERVQRLFAPWIERDNPRVYPIMGLEDPWYYRNKMEYSFSENASGEKFLGLVIAGSKGYVLNLDECHLTSPWFLEVVDAVRAWWEASDFHAYHPLKDEGTLRRITLREGVNTGDCLVNLTISGPFPKRAIEAYKEAVLKAMGEREVSIYLTVQMSAKGMKTQLNEMHIHGKQTMEEHLVLGEERLKFSLSPSSFFQPNTKQAQKFYLRARDMLNLQGDELLLDLYCGIGSIGMTMARSVRRVVGVELNPYAVYDGQESLELNGLDNVELLQGDVADVLSSGHLMKPDVIIVDPPRAGLGGKAVKQILEFAPQKILYISCNPETQAIDLEGLKLLYRVVAIQSVDQFAHTPHMENMILLEKQRKID